LRTDLGEIAGWQEVGQVLQDPHRLERDYHRRGPARPRGAQWETPESLRAQVTQLQRGRARLIDGEAEGVRAKGEGESRRRRVVVISQAARRSALMPTQTERWW